MGTEENCYYQTPVMSQSLQINTEFMSAHLVQPRQKGKCGSPNVILSQTFFLAQN